MYAQITQTAIVWEPYWLSAIRFIRFQRGKRAGYTPLELAGVEDPPSLAEVIDHLVQIAGASESTVAGEEQQLVEQPLLRAA